VFAKDGLVDELKKALSERVLNAELDEHLGDERTEGNTNQRNGSSQKTVLTGTSKMRLTIPRDRASTFDPKLIAKYQRRFPDFDDKIISICARHERAGDPRSPGGALRHRRVGHRCRAGRGGRMAEPTAPVITDSTASPPDGGKAQVRP
jgi:hypothetical protein